MDLVPWKDEASFLDSLGRYNLSGKQDISNAIEVRGLYMDAKYAEAKTLYDKPAVNRKPFRTLSKTTTSIAATKRLGASKWSWGLTSLVSMKDSQSSLECSCSTIPIFPRQRAKHSLKISARTFAFSPTTGQRSWIAFLNPVVPRFAWLPW
jgi:hypothetical protein